MDVAVKEYDAHLDAKKRLTLREANFDYYHISVFNDGRMLLEPRVLTSPFHISANTLNMMDQAVGNYRSGFVSPSLDLSEFEE